MNSQEEAAQEHDGEDDDVDDHGVLRLEHDAVQRRHQVEQQLLPLRRDVVVILSRRLPRDTAQANENKSQGLWTQLIRHEQRCCQTSAPISHSST